MQYRAFAFRCNEHKSYMYAAKLTIAVWVTFWMSMFSSACHGAREPGPPPAPPEAADPGSIRDE